MVAKEEKADKAALESSIIAEMRKKLRDEGIEYIVDRIPPDPNGKIRMLISRLDERT